MTNTTANQCHTRTQKSQYKTTETRTFEAIIVSIRAAAIARDDNELEKLLYQLDDAKINRDDSNAFGKRQIKNTLLNHIEDALDGNERFYKIIARVCDWL